MPLWDCCVWVEDGWGWYVPRVREVLPSKVRMNGDRVFMCVFFGCRRPIVAILSFCVILSFPRRNHSTPCSPPPAPHPLLYTRHCCFYPDGYRNTIISECMGVCVHRNHHLSKTSHHRHGTVQHRRPPMATLAYILDGIGYLRLSLWYSLSIA